MRGTTAALLSCALFGFGFIFRKILLNSLPPILIVALGSLLSALVLVFFMRVFHKMRECKCLTKRDILAIIFIGLVSGFMADLLFMMGLNETFVSNAVLLSRTNPLFMALFAVVFFREKISLHQIVGTGIMILGIYVIATQGFTLGLASRWADLLLISAGFLWALGNTVMKKYLSHTPPEVIVLGKTRIAGVALLFFSFSHVGEVTFTMNIVLNLLGLALISGVVGTLLWYKALELTSESNVGLTAFSIPLFSIIYANMFLGEMLAPYQIVGGALILVGLLILEIHLSQLKTIGEHLKIRKLLHT